MYPYYVLYTLPRNYPNSTTLSGNPRNCHLSNFGTFSANMNEYCLPDIALHVLNLFTEPNTAGQTMHRVKWSWILPKSDFSKIYATIFRSGSFRRRLWTYHYTIYTSRYPYIPISPSYQLYSTNAMRISSDLETYNLPYIYLHWPVQLYPLSPSCPTSLCQYIRASHFPPRILRAF